MTRIRIRQPDDFHVHFRGGPDKEQIKLLKRVAPLFSKYYGKAILMGNLKDKPIMTAQDLIEYKDQIKPFLAVGFEPYFTVMLTNKTTPQILEQVYNFGAKVLKIIPGQTSMHSSEGVPLIDICRPHSKAFDVLEKAQELDMVVSIHLELAVTPGSDEPILMIERENKAIDYGQWIIDHFPDLKIVFEHVTTALLIELIIKAPKNVAGTLTLHHALTSTEQVLDARGNIINPLLYCLPIAKSENDRQAVLNTMLSGSPRFFFGSDSAPHFMKNKRSKNPSVGIFTPPDVAIPLLWQLFDGDEKRFERFTARHGAQFYGLPINQASLYLKKKKWLVPKEYKGIPLFWAGKELGWELADE